MADMVMMIMEDRPTIQLYSPLVNLNKFTQMTRDCHFSFLFNPPLSEGPQQQQKHHYRKKSGSKASPPPFQRNAYRQRDGWTSRVIRIIIMDAVP